MSVLVILINYDGYGDDDGGCVIGCDGGGGGDGCGSGCDCGGSGNSNQCGSILCNLNPLSRFINILKKPVIVVIARQCRHLTIIN